MKNLTIYLSILCLLSSSVVSCDDAGNTSVSGDIVILGGTPGGIMAAVSAARMGKCATILERTSVAGGLPANGLGATDIHTRGATMGLFKEFVDSVKAYYVSTFGEDSPQVRDCSDGYHFEPHVASIVFERMIAAQGGRIKVITDCQFDSKPSNLRIENGRIVSLKARDRKSGGSVWYNAQFFIDATYEGDLAAAAGVPYFIGRESGDRFGEPGAGKVYKYWGGPEEPEVSTHEADDAVQAYNYRLCLTDNPDNLIPFEKPRHYDRNEYVSIIEDFKTGNNTFCGWVSGKKPQAMAYNGIGKVTNMVRLPNSKTDANNQHLAFLSTDLPEENWPWPEAGWKWRDRFAERLREYTMGLFWFVTNDPEVPQEIRDAASKWGLAADEYPDNGNFPRQVYVREGRRFDGQYFFTAADVLPVEGASRPPVSRQSITSSHYAMDSHAVHKREEGRIHLDGFFSYPTKPYTVPFGVMIPKDGVTNLLFPVPVSGSHVGFSTLRMEPCWMALGQAAGVAAALGIYERKGVQDIDVSEIQDELLSRGATLYYYKDLRPDDEDYALFERMGLDGYVPGWNADADSPVSDEDVELWKGLSSKDLTDMPLSSRREALKWIVL